MTRSDSARSDSARAELLILAAAFLVGAVAGVLHQAGIELDRYRRNTRAQLRAAAELLDDQDAMLEAAYDIIERQHGELAALERTQQPIVHRPRAATPATPSATYFDRAPTGDDVDDEPPAAA